MGCFTLISATGDSVVISLSPAIISQSAWLQAALDIGEEEGIVPIISTPTLQCLVAYMTYHTAYLNEEFRELELPISCTCVNSNSGLGYDVHEMLGPSDIEFFDSRFGTEDTWCLKSQEAFLELLVAADFVGHNHLIRVVLVYFSCRLMSTMESDILRWFPKVLKDKMEAGKVFMCGADDDGESGGEPLLLLSNEERLHVVREMQKIMCVEE